MPTKTKSKPANSRKSEASKAKATTAKAKQTATKERQQQWKKAKQAPQQRDSEGLCAKDYVYRAFADAHAQGQEMSVDELSQIAPHVSRNVIRKWRSLWSREEPSGVPVASRDYKPTKTRKRASAKRK